jgi:hypothetical protein
MCLPHEVSVHDTKDSQKGRATRWKDLGSLNDHLEGHLARNILIRLWSEQKIDFYRVRALEIQGVSVTAACIAFTNELGH